MKAAALARGGAMLAMAIAAQVVLTAHAAPGPDGTVVDVPDGQTLVIQRADGSRFSVRLAGIDAPERCQPWGPESKAALREAAFGQPVSLQGSGAAVRASVNGEDLSRRMVENATRGACARSSTAARW